MNRIAALALTLGLLACGDDLAPKVDSNSTNTANNQTNTATNGQTNTATNGQTNNQTVDPVPDPRPPADLPMGLHRVDTLEAGGPTTDLAPFFAATAEATVIGLGEAVHTSGGYYALKERLIRALIEEQGIRVFVIETPWSYTGPLDTFVNTPGCIRGAAISATNGSVFWVFVDDNFIDLLVSICQFNAGQPETDRVRIFGTDAQQPEGDIQAIEPFVRTNFPDEAEPLLAGLAMCSTTSVDFTSIPYPATTYEECLAGLDALELKVEESRESLQPLGNALSIFELHLRSYRSWQGQAFFWMQEDFTASYSARDVFMGEALLKLRELYFPDERAVFWAHDYHIAAAHDQAFMNWPPGAITAGTVLKRALGDAYMPFAITSKETGINWPNVEFSGFPSTGIEYELGELGEELLFMDATAEPMQRDGVSGLGDMLLSLRDNFSGVFWIENSPGMRAIYW